MPQIGKHFTFEAAHRLQNHNGKCRNLHGHSYKVEVSVTGEMLQTSGPEEGMLIDFGVLSEWWKAQDAVLDHTTILEEGDPLIPALAAVGKEGTRLTIMPWPPTAEHLAEWLRADLWTWLNKQVGNFIVSVTVYETAKSWASAG
jgi:6-pyruvoyltetrahydropterin/6-carboxytetrahydropterin synthase